jgi:ABC-type Fe3+-hydroxamate transport system substrate-binding protein
VALLLLAFAACRPAAPAVRAGGVVDDAGDTVAVAGSPRRIVSLIPATTELLFAIGAGGSVVGRTQWCDYPAAAAAVPNLGDGIAPNIEAILATRPDLVLLYNSAQNATAAARLRGLGIPALRLNTDKLADVDRIGRLLGRLTGHSASADSVAAVFDTALAGATVAPAGPRPKVLLLVWEQPPMTIGRGSFLDDLVHRAGGVNLFEDVSSTAGTVSIEAVASRDPDLILTTSAGPVAFATRPEWQVVRAVRERRFLPVVGSEFNRPSPRAPAAIRELTAKLRRAG